jgi:diguanylate cyclase (GGDEF)-like protein
MSQPNNLRILIIDDNPQIHHDFIKILTADTSSKKKELEDLERQLYNNTQPQKITLPAFQIDTATQGQEGVLYVDKAMKEGNPYALAFVDIRMPPGWDGIETIKHIWEIDENIQVVICTAYSDYSWEETVEQLGQRENLLILKKPFDNIAVRQLSMALTKKWQLLKISQEYTQELEKNVEERTRELEETLSVTRGTLESSIDGILVIDDKNNVLDYNTQLKELWQIPESILDGKNGTALFDHIAQQMEKPEFFSEWTKNLLTHPEVSKLDKFICKDNRVVEHYTQPYKLRNTVAGRIWGFRDVTERTRLEDKIQFQATHDPLTQLPNRDALFSFIRNEIIKAGSANQFAVLFFDLDRFKLINDSFSHAIGDELLKNIASRVKENLRESDFLARLGGDEFVIVISDFKSLESLHSIKNKLFNTFKENFELSGHQIIVTPSIGLSIYPDNGTDADELIRNADMAMYHAKELGGGQIQFYTPQLNQENLKQLEMETDLHRAIENNEFFLCYQPQFDLKDNKLISVEALIRWRHPEKGIILPIEFIPLAEEVGLISSMTQWIIREACRQNKMWQTAGLSCIRVAVNLTTREFQQPDLVNMIQTILTETQLEPKYLEIELTENIIVNGAEAIKKIQQLKDIGINLAIDDFGTGYSSLNYLRELPLDRLKIDQSFIKNIDVNRGDEVIIQAIITMAKNLNLEILAEGVETKNQVDFLKSKQCGEVQGYYFSKPLEATELEKILKDSNKDLLEKMR